jgi:hypothetical protein
MGTADHRACAGSVRSGFPSEPEPTRVGAVWSRIPARAGSSPRADDRRQAINDDHLPASDGLHGAILRDGFRRARRLQASAAVPGGGPLGKRSGRAHSQVAAGAPQAARLAPSCRPCSDSQSIKVAEKGDRKDTRGLRRQQKVKG